MIHPPSGLTIAALLNQLDSRPDQIALVSTWTPEFGYAEQWLADSCTSRGWQFQAIYDLASLAAESASIKLLMYADGIDRQLGEHASRFAGPTLKLQQLDPRTIVCETAAAIQSMSRL